MNHCKKIDSYIFEIAHILPETSELNADRSRIRPPHLVITVTADILPQYGARPSAGIFMTAQSPTHIPLEIYCAGDDV